MVSLILNYPASCSQLSRKAIAVRSIPNPINIGAQIITNASLGVPHHKYSIMGPKTLFYNY